MKTLNPKIRYTVDGHVATLYARPVAGVLRSKHWVAFGTCHVETIKAMKADGFKAHLALVSLLPQATA
jgi:hypothetical protein